MTHDFDGLVAAVTGGASGIGAAVVEVLRDRGARVAVLDLDPSGVPDGVLGVRPTSATTHRSATRSTRWSGSSGRLDVLVNNAGVGAQGTVADNDDESGAASGGQRHRHGADQPRRAAPPAPLTGGRDRQHRARSPPPRGSPSGRPTAPARARCSPSPGRWPPTTSARGSASTASTPAPPTHRGSVGCWTAARPGRRARGPRGAAAARPAGRRRGGRPRGGLPGQPAPGRPRARRSRSTAGCRTSASGPAASRARRGHARVPLYVVVVLLVFENLRALGWSRWFTAVMLTVGSPGIHFPLQAQVRKERRQAEQAQL